MNIEAYNLIIETISKILEAKEFKAVDFSDGSYFTNGTVAVKVCYDDARELFTLEHSVMEEEAPSTDWKTLSSWLFAADAPVKEAKSIANDFEDSEALRQEAEKSWNEANTAISQMRNIKKYVSEDGEVLVFDNIEDAQKEADACQNGTVVKLKDNGAR